MLALALAACAAPGDGDGAGAPPEAPAAAPAMATMARVAPEPAAPPPPPPRLIGRDHAEIVDILGQPAFQRQDAPALLLRYQSDGCILDLFLYPADEAGSPTVEHVEARTSDGQSAVTDECVSAVLRAKAAAAAG